MINVFVYMRKSKGCEIEILIFKSAEAALEYIWRYSGMLGESVAMHEHSEEFWYGHTEKDVEYTITKMMIRY